MATSSLSTSTILYKRSALHSLASSARTSHQNRRVNWGSSLGLGKLSQWNGLKHMGILISPRKSVTMANKRQGKGQGAYASLFGVGAPEALVIGVVALLVFGPKGLAEVARNLGKTLRAFQPTIRELQDVSREFKSTLEREIGLDEISSPPQNTYNSNQTTPMSPPSSIMSTVDPKPEVDLNRAPPENKAYTSEEYLKITEEQLKASAAQQPGLAPEPKENQIEPQAQVQESFATEPPPQKTGNKI